MAGIGILVGLVTAFVVSLATIYQYAFQAFPAMCYWPKLGDVKEWMFLYSVLGGVFLSIVCYYSRRVSIGIRVACIVALLVIASAGAYASTKACGCTCTGCQEWFEEWFGGFASWCFDK